MTNAVISAVFANSLAPSCARDLQPQWWWNSDPIMMTSSNGNIFRVTGPLCEFPSQSPVTRSFDVLFHPCLNKRLNKQSWGWWFETPSRSVWRHCNDKCVGSTRDVKIYPLLRKTRYFNLKKHWNGDVIILVKFSSWGAWEVAKMIISSAVINENFVKIIMISYLVTKSNDVSTISCHLLLQ